MTYKPAFKSGLRSSIQISCEDGFNSLAFGGSLPAFVPHVQPPQATSRHVRDKIRQQLQVLRELRMVEFLGDGLYRALEGRRSRSRNPGNLHHRGTEVTEKKHH